MVALWHHGQGVPDTPFFACTLFYEEVDLTTPFQTISLFSRELLLKQTLFGMPWALAGALLPRIQGRPCVYSPDTLFLVFLAFCSARFAGMSFNRYIDRHIDALNPRTRERALPQGRIAPWCVAASGCVSLAIFLLVMRACNPLCGMLASIVAPLIILYPFAKRYTLFCHLLLGGVQFFIPLAAEMAVSGSCSETALLLGVACGSSIAASDIIYACQDVAFDRLFGVHSIPARLGIPGAFFFAALLHLVTIVSLYGAAVVGAFHAPYYGCITAATLLLVAAYARMWQASFAPHMLERTFTRINSILGCLVCVACIGEWLWR